MGSCVLVCRDRCVHESFVRGIQAQFVGGCPLNGPKVRTTSRRVVPIASMRRRAHTYTRYPTNSFCPSEDLRSATPSSVVCSPRFTTTLRFGSSLASRLMSSNELVCVRLNTLLELQRPGLIWEPTIAEMLLVFFPAIRHTGFNFATSMSRIR